VFEITIGGKKVRPEDLGKELEKAAAKQVAEKLHERISSIRHPATGEFPTVVAIANSLQEIDIRAEGSPELIALIRERMSEEDRRGAGKPDRCDRCASVSAWRRSSAGCGRGGC
jgi:hypothetical protein